MLEDEAEDYHKQQIEVLAATDADLVHAMTPSHFESALPGGAIGARIRGVRANASRMSHAETR
jgi:hypothetical protein